MTIEGPKNVNNKSTARSPPTSCHNNRSHFTDKQTQIHNHKRSQPVLTQPGYNRIKKYMTSPQKSISQAHLCACVCVDVPKNRRKKCRLHLVEFNSTKATQSHADTIPTHSTSPRHATVGPECTSSLSKTGRHGP